MSTATFPNIVKLVDLNICQFHIEILHQVDHYNFQTKIYYPDVDLFKLPEKYSPKLLNKIYAHIALCETFKYCSLFPAKIDLSYISSYISPQTLTFFSHVFQNAMHNVNMKTALERNTS